MITMTTQILIDSNVLVYAINDSSSKNKVARVFLKKSFKNSNLCLAQQNITESLRILTHNKFPKPWNAKEAIEQISKMTNNMSVISPNIKTLFYFFEIIRKIRVSSKQIFDAYLVATALSNGVFTIATDNVRDFKIFEEINIINPFK